MPPAPLGWYLAFTVVMQKYLQPNTTKISTEEAQLIFKIRYRTPSVKVNLKGKYESYECRACHEESESQEHIAKQCKISNQEGEQVDFEKIFNGTVEEKLKIARKFQENFEMLEKLIS